jgi:hypothetical protein
VIERNRVTGLVFAGCVLLGLAPPSLAEDWAFSVVPYLWAASIDGDLSIDGHDFSASASFTDILDQAKYGGALILAADKGNWVNFAQLDYAVLEDKDVDTPFPDSDGDLELDNFLATVATGYHLPLGEKFSVDIMAGLRYAWVDVKVDVNALLDVGESAALYDGILVLRPRYTLSEKWAFLLSASVGKGDSELTWQVFPELIYDIGELEVRFGYRDLYYDVEEEDIELDLSMRGVLVGVG